MTTPPPNSRAAINTCVRSLLSPHGEELDRLHNRLYIGTIQSALLSSRPDWRADDKSAVQVYTAVIATKKSTLSPTFPDQDLPQLYKLLEYLTIRAIQRLAPLHHHIPSRQEVYITHQRTSGRGPGLVCAANQRTGFHENSLRQKINQSAPEIN